MSFALDIRTADDRAADALAAAKQAAKAECRRRILSVMDATAQINLAAAAAAGDLSDSELAVYREALGWIGQMRATWRPMAEAGEDPADDAGWPARPDGLQALLDRV